jgi:hypothetical protein
MQSGPKPYFSAPAAPPPLPADVEPAMPDPLAEAGDVVWYVRPPSGGQFGPANSDVMRTWLSEGRISADSLVWREGWREWQEAGGIFPHFRVSQVAMLATAETPALSGLEPVASHQHGVKPRRYRPKDTVTVVLLIIAFIFLLIVFFWILFRPQ